ncbi:hypothetical protein FHX42_001487 [Saccharopolyspora lacisalsi]|uniref:Transposase IS4-like domain-containing protein n=1 Tax=Halosaccharopolyspora lacisalsi TaxID=1000566 RepID=A0A839DZJ1_9PSEU|nr:hypothetical protein [Halosaccharopolyspora lacisalsi]
MTGPGPADRGKADSTIHLLSEQVGLPLAMGVSAANTHDSHGLRPLVTAIPKVRSRRGPQRGEPAELHGDKGYDYDELRRWPRQRGITPRIAGKGIESSDAPGRYRWVIERSLARLPGYRLPTQCYERHGHLFSAFLTLAAALT